MSWAPGSPARSYSSWTSAVSTAVSPTLDDVDVGEPLVAPDEVAFGVAGDVAVAVADLAAVGRPAQVRVVQRAQRVGVAGDERARPRLGGRDDLVAHAHAVSWARRDSPRISARMRSRRGSVEWSTCLQAAATAGCTAAIAVCIAWATAR